MEYFSNGTAQINYNEEAKRVEIRWKKALESGENYKLILTKALVVNKQFEVEAWLNDLSLIEKFPRDAYEWFENNLLPNIEEDHIRKVAIITQKENNVLQLPRPEHIGHLDIFFCCSEDKANKWFLKN